MKYQSLGNTGIEVSQISFGAWGIGGGNTWADRQVDAKEVSELLDEAMDLGINYIDTAPVYGIGRSEEILGEALVGKRDHFIVQTKCSLNWRNEGGEFEYERDGYIVNKDHHASAIRKDVEGSLLRMKLDHIDALVVHRMSKVVPVEETMSELNQLIEEGKIRVILLSNSTPEDFEEYAKYGTIAGVQERFSLLVDEKRNYFPTCEKYNAVFQVYASLEEGALTGKAPFEKEYKEGDVRASRPWFKEPMKSRLLQLFTAWEPLCEKYDCSIANLVQAWTLEQYSHLNLLTGFRRKETMRDTCKVLDIPFASEDLAFMKEQVKEIIK